jgi:2,4-dienoyl-CoA reductase (NADPH2)
MSQFHHLFTPIKVGNLTLKNRLIQTSMGLGPGYYQTGRPTKRLINFLEERARGGVSLICTSVSFYPSDVMKEHLAAAYSQENISDLRMIVESVHRYGTLMAGQIVTIRHWRRAPAEPEYSWGASELVFHKGLEPRSVMTKEDIKTFIAQQAETARILKAAGFDAVEILAGIGNPISHFLSKASNKRTDEYGGGVENRCRFLIEDVQAIKKACGDDFPVLVRFSPIDYIPGGNDIEDAKQIVPILERAGVSWLNCQVGWHESVVPLTTKDIPDGHWSFITAELKKVTTVPLVSTYRYTDPLVMERTIAEGRADIIGGARYLIADPEFANKAKEGRLEEIRKCICCCRCLDDVVGRWLGLEYCSVNPRLGPELETPVERAQKQKKVMIAGGGPAGLSAAVTAAKRGHDVTIYERGPRIGGCLSVSAIFSPMYERLINYYKVQLGKTQSIKIRLNTTVNRHLVKMENPDVLIIAVGGIPIDLNVPGEEKGNVMRSHDFLDLINGYVPQKAGLVNKIMFNLGAIFLRFLYSPGRLKKFMGLKWPFGNRVAIIGGGLPGCDLAVALGEHHRKLAIFGEGRKIGFDIGASDRFHILSKLKSYSVQTEPEAKVTEITEKGLKAIKAGESELVYEVDTVAVTMGFQKNMDLANELRGEVPILLSVGDCVDPKRMPDATKQGYKAALNI